MKKYILSMIVFMSPFAMAQNVQLDKLMNKVSKNMICAVYAESFDANAFDSNIKSAKETLKEIKNIDVDRAKMGNIILDPRISIYMRNINGNLDTLAAQLYKFENDNIETNVLSRYSKINEQSKREEEIKLFMKENYKKSNCED